MTDLNNVTLIGRITKDLDDKTYGVSANGFAHAKVSIAVNRSVKKGEQWQDETSFFDVSILGKTAENLKPYLVKGAQLAVQGYLKQDRWQDKQSGQTRSSIGVIVDSMAGGKVQLVGGRRDNGNGQPSFQGQQAQQNFNPAEGFPEDMPF